MTIFGTTSVVIGNATYTHKGTVWDDVTNYTLGAILIALLPCGILFNGLVYLKNHLHPGTPSSLIYRCLAISDFLACTVRGVQQIVALVSPTQLLFYDTSTPTTMTQVVALVTMMSGISMMTVVTLLSGMRLLSLTAPFWAREHSTKLKWFVIVYILTTLGASTWIAVPYIFSKNVYFSSVTQWIVPFQAETSQFLIDVIIPVVSMTITSISSLLTVVYLVRSGATARRRSSITILLMSAGLIGWNLMLFVALSPKGLPIGYVDMAVYLEKGQYEMYYLYYLITCFFPLVLAVYNSFVVVIRSSEIRLFVSRSLRWACAVYHAACNVHWAESDNVNLIHSSSNDRLMDPSRIQGSSDSELEDDLETDQDQINNNLRNLTD